MKYIKWPLAYAGALGLWMSACSGTSSAAPLMATSSPVREVSATPIAAIKLEPVVKTALPSALVLKQVKVAPTVYNCYNTTPYVRLSFDDSASQASLNTILATLKKHNVRGYFFFNTSTTFKAKYDQIRRAGHIIGNHTYSHPQLTKLSVNGIRDQLLNGRSSATNTNLVRPPYGATNDLVRFVIASLKYQQCLWNVDTMDWSQSATKSPNDIIRRVRKGDKWTSPAKSGDMILMHGTGKYTPAALPGVIAAIKERGLQLEPLRR